ncbi:MAG TPA: hypothetical protein VLE20_13580 [Blastocatellia bacterium]|nr:hypothetical protein [Blastocatellia bacterium]
MRSNVSRGEDAGRNLTHTAVVRKLSKLGAINPTSDSFSIKSTAKIERRWNRIHLKAFVQERASRRVLGADSVSIASAE